MSEKLLVMKLPQKTIMMVALRAEENLFWLFLLKKIAGPNWGKHSEEFFEKMKSMDGVRLPGERRHKNRLDKGPRKINKELIEKINKLSK